MSPAEDPTSLGAILVDAGLVTPRELKDAVAFHKTMEIRLGEALCRVADITEHDIDIALAHQQTKRLPWWAVFRRLFAATDAVGAAARAFSSLGASRIDRAARARRITLVDT